MNGPLFSGASLACRRGGRFVFGGVDFALAPGGALLLAGRNGAGKSSLLRLMAGLSAPAAGRLLWDGADIAAGDDPHGDRLHYVGHLDAVKPALTVAENLGFWTALRGGSRVMVMPALERLGLAALADVPGRLLSSGQKRRLALSRLLTAPARLWLLDEPTVGLDHQSVAILAAMLAEHRAGGGMLVAATHVAFDLPGASTLTLDRAKVSVEEVEA